MYRLSFWFRLAFICRRNARKPSGGSPVRNVFIHPPGADTVEVVLANPTMSPVLRPDGCPQGRAPSKNVRFLRMRSPSDPGIRDLRAALSDLDGARAWMASI